MVAKRTRQEQGRSAKKTGRKAERIFADLLDDWDWIARKDDPDEGIDFNVEVPASPEGPAFRFLVQVKGSEQMKRRSDGSWSVRISRKRLREYREHRLPVFVIGVDRSSKHVLWETVDAPEIEAPPKNGRRGSHVSLRLPPSQKLQATISDEFRMAVVRAMERRDDKHHPPALALEIRRRIKEEIDPRFQVGASILNGREQYTFSARQPVDLAMRFSVSGREDAEALRDMMRFGTPASVRTSAFKMNGSPLFEGLSGEGVLTLMSKREPVRLCIGYRRRSGYVWSFDETAEMFSGLEGGVANIRVPACPLEISLKVDVAQSNAALTYTVTYGAWEGADIRSLPYLSPIRDFFEGTLKSGSIEIAMRKQGETTRLTSVAIRKERKAFRQLAEVFEAIGALQKICKASDQAFSWRRGEVTRGEMTTWEKGAALLSKQRLSVGCQECTARIEDESVGLSLVSARASVVARDNPFVVRAWGENVTELPVLVALNNYAVTYDRSTKLLRIARIAGSSATMILDVDPESEPPAALFETASTGA